MRRQKRRSRKKKKTVIVIIIAVFIAAAPTGEAAPEAAVTEISPLGEDASPDVAERILPI